MKVFLIAMAFLSGFFGVGHYFTSNLETRSHNSTLNMNEMKRIYIPSISCKIITNKIDVAQLDYYAKECFAIGPEQLKMTLRPI